MRYALFHDNKISQLSDKELVEEISQAFNELWTRKRDWTDNYPWLPIADKRPVRLREALDLAFDEAGRRFYSQNCKKYNMEPYPRTPES